MASRHPAKPRSVSIRRASFEGLNPGRHSVWLSSCHPGCVGIFFLIFVLRKVDGTDNFDFGFGFMDLKRATHRCASWRQLHPKVMRRREGRLRLEFGLIESETAAPDPRSVGVNPPAIRATKV
jgi:hypothetical protein